MDLTADFRKTFPSGVTVQANFALKLGAFSLSVLFGPSGCGKTTVLRCLAGLEQPDAGLIQAGEERWFRADGGNRVPAAERSIGYVFQEPLLFPHLSVAGNIAYGLRGWSAPDRDRRVDALIELMGLEGFGARKPSALSGGQKQRVSLARALAPRPRLVLLDEPFASLDRAAAEQLRHHLRQILQALEAPAILVTHNPMEALALGDRMLRMADGRIVQEGAPSEVLSQGGSSSEEPMGMLVRARVVGRAEGLLRLAAGTGELFAPDPGGAFQEAYACIRGEGVSLELDPAGTRTQRNRLAATIVGFEALGALTRVHLDAGFPFEALVTTWAWEDLRLAQGQTVMAFIKATAIRVIPVEA